MGLSKSIIIKFDEHTDKCCKEKILRSQRTDLLVPDSSGATLHKKMYRSPKAITISPLFSASC